MKVLLITDNHTLSGGAERYFFELKERLQTKPGIAVHSLGFADTEMVGENFHTFKELRSNGAKLFWRMIINPRILRKLRQTIRAINPDVIHVHNVKQYSATLLKAIKPYPVVQTVHDFSLICPTAQNIHQNKSVCLTGIRRHCFWQHRVKFGMISYLAVTMAYYSLVKSLRKTVNAFIAPSPFLADYLKLNRFENTYCVTPFKSHPKPYSFESMQANEFLFAGNFGNHKGVHLLLDEFAQAVKVNPQLRLNMAGTGPEQNSLCAKVKQLGLTENVHFLGWQKDLSSYYSRCNALIFPSIGLESFGLVITEAMAHARAVIAVNRGTAAWLVDANQTGILFDPLKSGALAEAILYMADHPELARTWGINAHEKLQQFMGDEEVLDKIVGVYKTLLL